MLDAPSLQECLSRRKRAGRLVLSPVAQGWAIRWKHSPRAILLVGLGLWVLLWVIVQLLHLPNAASMTWLALGGGPILLLTFVLALWAWAFNRAPALLVADVHANMLILPHRAYVVSYSLESQLYIQPLLIDCSGRYRHGYALWLRQPAGEEYELLFATCRTHQVEPMLIALARRLKLSLEPLPTLQLDAGFQPVADAGFQPVKSLA